MKRPAVPSYNKMVEKKEVQYFNMHLTTHDVIVEYFDRIFNPAVDCYIDPNNNINKYPIDVFNQMFSYGESIVALGLTKMNLVHTLDEIKRSSNQNDQEYVEVQALGGDKTIATTLPEMYLEVDPIPINVNHELDFRYPTDQWINVRLDSSPNGTGYDQIRWNAFNLAFVFARDSISEFASYYNDLQNIWEFYLFPYLWDHYNHKSGLFQIGNNNYISKTQKTTGSLEIGAFIVRISYAEIRNFKRGGIVTDISINFGGRIEDGPTSLKSEMIFKPKN